MHAFVRGIKIEDLAEGTRFDHMLSLLAVWHSDELNWDVDGCFGWCHCEFWTGVVRGVPAYWQQGRGFQKLSPVRQAGVMAWTMEKGAEELERVRQRLVIRSQPISRKSEKKDGVISPVRVPVPARGAPAAGDKECDPSLTIESRDLPNSERSMGLHLMVILKERQKQK